MKNKNSKSVSAVILIICTLLCVIPGSVYAALDIQNNSELTFKDILAGVATVEDVFGKLDEATVPEIVGYDYAVSKCHIERLYNEEGSDLNKIIFLNADGSKTQYLYDFPVKYIDENGEIKDITLEIEQTNTAGQYKTAASSSVTTFSKHISDGIGLAGNGENISLVPHLPSKLGEATMQANRAKTTDSIAKMVDNKKIIYDYDSKTKIEYSLTYTGFKEDIVVSEYTGQTEYDFTLYTNGLKLIEKNGSYCMVDGNGEVKAILGEIIIFTADEKNNTMGELEVTTVVENQEYLLTVKVDPEYLADEKTAYPIKIDPTVEIYYEKNGSGAIADVTLNSLSGSDGSSTVLTVGKRATYGISRVLMKFPGLNLNSLGDNIIINSATVEIRDVMCEAEALEISCYIFQGNEWNESTVNWSNVNPNNISSYLSSNIISYANGRNQSTLYRYSYDITNAVQCWKDNICNQNKGIIFKASTAVENGSTYIKKTFASYNSSSYMPSLSVTYSDNENHIRNDTYYLNNKEHGKYLKYDNSKIPTNSSGLISSLGNSIRWEIRSINDGYVIRSKIDPTKYLAVPSGVINEYTCIETITDSAIPLWCKWNITVASGGGCLVQSKFNSRYLYSTGDKVFTDNSTAATGTSKYFSRVWRLADTTYYGNTSNSSHRELTEDFSFDTCYLFSGETKSPKINITNNSTSWSTISDFAYINYSPAYVSFDYITSSFTAPSPSPYYTVVITAIHKVTNRTKTFTLVINPLAVMIGVKSGNHDHETALYESKETILKFGYSDVKIHTRDFSISELDDYLNINTNNLFVSRSHGTTMLSNGRQIGTSILIKENPIVNTEYTSTGSINNLELSNMKLVMFIGCETGAGGENGLNLPAAAVNNGAKTAVGFSKQIDCKIANEWTKDFFKLIYDKKYSVQKACDELAKTEKYSNTNMTSYVICGYKYTTLN